MSAAPVPGQAGRLGDSEGAMVAREPCLPAWLPLTYLSVTITASLRLRRFRESGRKELGAGGC